jgi:hypothetical protein
VREDWEHAKAFDFLDLVEGEVEVLHTTEGRGMGDERDEFGGDRIDRGPVRDVGLEQGGKVYNVVLDSLSADTGEPLNRSHERPQFRLFEVVRGEAKFFLEESRHLRNALPSVLELDKVFGLD